MVYQETASLISVIEGQTYSVRKPPPPAFLFPNQRCQRPDRQSRPHPIFARAAARRGVNSRRPPVSQSGLDVPASQLASRVSPGRRNRIGGRRGAPLISPLRVD
jgi:hypothetical protein